MQTLRHGQGASGSLNSLELSVQGQNSIELCILETLVDAISLFFFLPLPFFSIFISTRTSVQNYTERRETEKFQDGNLKNKLFKIFMKLFEKFFTRISWIKLNEKFTHFDIPRNSKNLNFGKILKEIFSNAILSHICEYSINYL